VIGVVTVIADSSNPYHGQPVVVAAVAAVGVACVLGWGMANRQAAVLGAIGLAVAVSWVPVADLMTWAAYRTRLSYAHENMAKVIDAAPFTGSVAIGDAGIVPFLIHQPAIDLGGLADPEIAHGTFDDAYLQAHDLQMVIALSPSPAAGSEWVMGPGFQVTYQYMRTHAFYSSGGPPLGPSYWLNYWIDPKVDTPQLHARLDQVSARAKQEDLQSDSQVLVHHFWDFPFLSTGN
jgi:hypothetical protein